MSGLTSPLVDQHHFVFLILSEIHTFFFVNIFKNALICGSGSWDQHVCKLDIRRDQKGLKILCVNKKKDKDFCLLRSSSFPIRVLSGLLGDLGLFRDADTAAPSPR